MENKKCFNTGCENVTLNNNKYCCFKCRNIYVNKNLRNYENISISLSKNKIEEYEKDPSFCKNCNKKLEYKIRKNLYCNHSCAAKQTNKRKHTESSIEKRREKLKKYYKINPFPSRGTPYVKKKKFCKFCNTELINNKLKFCNYECKKKFQRRNSSEFVKYKLDTMFKFNLANYPEEFNFELIKEYGWYAPANRGNNLGGVSRDHMYSVRDGFDNNIDPFMLAHPANCNLVLQKENSSKHKKSSITIEELKKRIELWNKKYNSE